MNPTHLQSRHLGTARILFLGAAAAACLFTTGCSWGARNAASNAPACCVRSASSEPVLPDASLYQLDSTWVNDANAPLKLSELSGGPIVLTLFFAHCEFACPVLVHDMKRIETALPTDARANVRFVLVSFDSERDTPAALATYRARHELGGNWTLLRGEPDDVLELAALLGVKFKRDARGQFSHSNLITLLNPQGESITQLLGLNSHIDDFVTALTRLATSGTPRNQ